MAMTTCSECGNAVSTEAASCPNCGAPPAKFRPIKPVNKGPQKGFFIAACSVVTLLALVYSSQERGNVPAPHAAASYAAPDAATVVERPPVVAAEPAPEPTPPPPPSHHYSIEQDGEYGYEPAVSESDRQAGTAVKPMLMVRFLGTNAGTTRFSSVDGGARTVFSCKEACDVVRSISYFEGQQVRQDTMRVAPGSLIEAIVEDIENDQLKVYSSKR